MLTERLVTEINDVISHTKALHYENLAIKRNNPLLQAKTYWSILKTFYNDKKIPLIPPLLIDYKFTTDAQSKDVFSINFLLTNVQPLKTTVYFQLTIFNSSKTRVFAILTKAKF